MTNLTNPISAKRLLAAASALALCLPAALALPAAPLAAQQTPAQTAQFDRAARAFGPSLRCAPILPRPTAPARF